jgi:hypothetical protein
MLKNSLLAILCVIICTSCQQQNKKREPLQPSNSTYLTPEIHEEIVENKNAQPTEPLKVSNVSVSKENPLAAFPWHCIIELVAFSECEIAGGTTIGK